MLQDLRPKDTEQCYQLLDKPQARGLTSCASLTEVPTDLVPENKNSVIMAKTKKMEGECSMLHDSMWGSLQDFSSLALENARIEVELTYLWTELGLSTGHHILRSIEDLIERSTPVDE